MYLWMEGILIIIIGAVVCEAMVQIWFYGAPIQWLRNLIRFLTPFLYSKRYGKHMVDCQYCTSVWMGFLVTLFFYNPNTVLFFISWMAIHRLSNFLHITFSYMWDKQIDLRVARK